MMLNLQKIPSKIESKRHCPAGSGKRPLYKYVYDEKYGCPRRQISGHQDVREYIQASADDVDFKAIGKMLVDSKQNIVDHFKSAAGPEYDIVGMPRNVHEYNAMHNKLKEKFESLDPEIKGLFNNDLDTFRTAYLKGNVKGTLKTYVDSKKVKPVEVKEGEE